MGKCYPRRIALTPKFLTAPVDDKELIQLALGLSSPWYVKEIDLNVSEKRMDIYLDFTRGKKFPCPV